MASESRENATTGTDVPAELDEWLDERAASLGVERDELVAQVLSSYRAAATLDGQLDAAEVLDLEAEDFVDVETSVTEAVDEKVAAAAADVVDDRVGDSLSGRIDDRVAERVAVELDQRLDDAVADRFEDLATDLTDDVAEAVRSDVASDRQTALDDVQATFQAKVEDVRERVIQVKQETDDKAPADHSHDEFQTIDALDERVDALAEDLAKLREDVTDRIDEQEATSSELTRRVDEAQEKLNRVAWVVSDLKDDASGRDAYEQAVDRIKRAAAQEGVSTADCERCDETVHVGLLTDPECPHCNATVSDVRPSGGFFRKKARLVAASQLESGEESENP